MLERVASNPFSFVGKIVTMEEDRDEVSSDRNDGDSERVTEAEALAGDGTRYRTLEVSKGGESRDEDAE